MILLSLILTWVNLPIGSELHSSILFGFSFSLFFFLFDGAGWGYFKESKLTSVIFHITSSIGLRAFLVRSNITPCNCNSFFLATCGCTPTNFRNLSGKLVFEGCLVNLLVFPCVKLGRECNDLKV